MKLTEKEHLKKAIFKGLKLDSYLASMKAL